MKKRLLAMLLTLCMLFTMMPAAFAADNDDGTGAPDAVEVADFESLAEALSKGSPVKLTQDITATDKVGGTNVSMDLNGNTLTLTVGTNQFEGTSEIENGTICVTGAKATGNGIVEIGPTSNKATLTLNQVDLTGDGYSSAFAVLMVFGGSTLNVNGGSWTLSNEQSSLGGVVKNQDGAGTPGTINITGTEMNFRDVQRGFTGGTVTLDGVDMTITGGDNGINGCALTVKDSMLNISDGVGRALTVTGADVTVENSTLTFSGNKEADIRFKSANTLSLDATSTLNACKAFADKEGAKINGTAITGTESNKTTVSVKDGKVTAIPENANTVVVSKDGSETYKTLEDAISEAQSGDTITLLKDASGNGIVIQSNSDITLDFGGHTYNIDGTTVGSSGTETNGFQLLRDSKVTFKNGTLTSDKAKILIQNYCDLTLEDMILDGSKLPGSGRYVLSNNFGDINIVGKTSITAKEGDYAFDLYYWPSNGYGDGVNVTVDTTGTITGTIEYDADSTGAADMHDKCALIIKNGTFNGKISTYSCNENPNIKISGGTFSSKPDASYLATGYEAVEADGVWKIQKVEGKLVAGAEASDGTASAVIGGTYNPEAPDAGHDSTVEVATGKVEFDVTTNDSSVGEAQVNVDPATAASLSEAKVDVVVKTDVAEVKLDSTVMNKVAQAASEESTVELVVKDTTPEGAPAGTAVYEVKLQVNGEDVVPEESAGSNGTITITVPKPAGDAPTVYFMKNGVPVQKMTIVDQTETTITFETNHLSEYGVFSAPQQTAVAQRGEKVYTSLQAAIDDNTNTAATIKLLDNITVSGEGVAATNGAITINKAITIDGNGKTITANDKFAYNETSKRGEAHVINITGGVVTIKNLTIDGNTNTSAATKHAARSGINVYTASGASAAQVTLTKVTVKNCSTYGVTSQGSVVTATDLVTQNNAWGGVNVDTKAGAAAGGTFTMKSGTLNEANALYVENSGNAADGADVIIEGGTFNGAVSVAQANSADVANVNLTVKGGTFSNSVAKYAKNGGLDYQLTSGGKYTYYDSFANAEKAAVSGDTIEKMDNTGALTATVTVKFDLNRGRCDITELTVPKNAKITLPKPTRSGYEFRGWYDEDGKRVGYDGDKYEVKANVTLEAEWREIVTETGDYDVSVKSAKNGSVKVSPTSADKGDTVTITVKPSKGYVLDELIVTDKKGNELKLKDKGNGKYTFTMPASKVTVKATFVKESEQTETPAKDQTIVLTLGTPVATVGGVQVVNDVAPIARNNRTLLPIRFVAEALGATVDWNADLQKVTIAKTDLLIEIYLGQTTAYVNGNPVVLDVAAFAENNRTYLPLRFVAESLGATVLWDQPTQSVTIIPA